MNVIIKNVDNKEKEQVIIECIEVTEEVERIRLFAESSGQTLSGSIDGRFYSVNIGDIYYFEAVDERIFASTFEPDKRFSYAGFLSPIIFGMAASFPSLVMFSRHELTVGETIFRKILHLLLLELTINGILFLNDALVSLSVTISLAVMIFVIDVAVNVVMYINDLRSAELINRGIRQIQSEKDK